jgi:hypothetical protein
MFDGPHPGRGSSGRSATAAASRRPAPVASDAGEAVAIAADADESGAGLWDADLAAEAEAEASSAAAVDATLPTGDEALDIGRVALDDGDVAGAALQLALVLRIAPALAPAVIDLVADRHEPGLAFVRGDAYRLVGRELDARRAYADATRSTAEPDLDAEGAAEAETPDTDPPAEGDPA